MLFLKRGTREGAIAGLVAGVVTIFVLSPFFPMLAGDALGGVLATMRGMIDTGAWGLVVNVTAFVLVSLQTQKPTHLIDHTEAE
jgi:Na+/proline symporter